MEHIRMKQIPDEDRPYEKCLRLGPESLSDAELLAIMIRTGSKDENSLDLAYKILALNYPNEGILGLLNLTLQQLMGVKGIGKVKGTQLLCIGEFSKRIWKRNITLERKSFQDPQTIFQYYKEELRHLKKEQFCMMLFNTKMELIKDIILSQGTINASLASIREVFLQALRFEAVKIIIVHNHPTGNPAPSKEDIALTNRMKEAGALLEIPLMDHVVIGDTTYYSFKERGLL